MRSIGREPLHRSCGEIRDRRTARQKGPGRVRAPSLPCSKLDFETRYRFISRLNDGLGLDKESGRAWLSRTLKVEGTFGKVKFSQRSISPRCSKCAAAFFGRSFSRTAL